MGLTIKEREKREKDQWLKAFGDHLRKVRKEKEISAAELARLMLMERSHIARLEMGRVNPSFYLIKKISVALEMSIQKFLEDFDSNG